MIKRNRKTTEQFISESILKHGYKYNYSKTQYINNKTQVIIICPNHGEFLQTPDSHKRGSGCPKCEGKYLNQDEFIFKCNLKHYHKYDYSLIKYSKGSDILNIICPNHGIFKQKASYHLAGSGCNICYIKSKGEKLISNILDKKGVYFEQQKRFHDCKYKGILYFDFYLEKLNILIEFNGIQHYKPVQKFGGEETFKIQKIKDDIKIKYCQKNNIKLIIIMYNELKNLENTINNLLI